MQEGTIQIPVEQKTVKLLPEENKGRYEKLSANDLRKKVKIIYECSDTSLKEITDLFTGRGINLIKEEENSELFSCKKGLKRISSITIPKYSQKIRLTQKTLSKYSDGSVNLIR